MRRSSSSLCHAEIVPRLQLSVNGRGGGGTCIAVPFGETARTVKTMAKRFISAESTVMSDEDPAYRDFKKHFAKHEPVAPLKAVSPRGVLRNTLAEVASKLRHLLRSVLVGPPRDSHALSTRAA